jgi:pimeloyl-ACP methyl ester carboxylesterase
VAQGGDWGAHVSSAIGWLADPAKLIGIHINWALADPAKLAEFGGPNEEEQGYLALLQNASQAEIGYAIEQGTKPQTLGYGLTDSPVGQLAWIVEKFWSWTDCDGHPENVLTRDELLDNVMLYWLTASAASSARLYWESFRVFGGKRERVELPTGVASFPKEILRAPRSWCEAGYNITHWTNMPRGGHFAAFEQPELFVDDVSTFFATVR